MRNLILTTLAAAALVPTAAIARDRGYVSQDELRRDRQDVYEERRDLRDAYRRGDRDDIREERREYGSAVQEYREDKRDWHSYRRHNPNAFRRGSWRSGHAYRAYHPGHHMNRGYYGGRYVINDPWRYRLPPAYGSTNWVRHHDDVLLVDVRSGRVLRAHRNFFW